MQIQSPLAWDVSVVDGVIQALLPREDLKRELEKLHDSEMELTVPPLPFWFTIPSNFAQESGLQAFPTA